MHEDYVSGHEVCVHYGQTARQSWFQKYYDRALQARKHRALYESILRDGVKGDCIECGVWRGGAALFMRGFCAGHQVTERIVWLANSFEGLPRPSLEADKDLDLSAGKLAVDDEAGRDLFQRYGLLDGQVKFLKG